MPPQPVPPTVTRTRHGRLVLSSGDLSLTANLGALVRHAVARTSSEACCAALLGVSVRRLREIAAKARVPLMFVAPADTVAEGARR
jgi:hypothetical protein